MKTSQLQQQVKTLKEADSVLDFAVRIATALLENQSSTALFFVQRAFPDDIDSPAEYTNSVDILNNVVSKGTMLRSNISALESIEQEGEEAITDDKLRFIKNSVARDKGYSDWERMENFIMDHNDSGNTGVLLVSAMEDVIRELFKVQSPAPAVNEHLCSGCAKVLKPIYLCADCVEDTFKKRGIYSKATKQIREMKTLIKDLKKGDKFRFNHTIYEVKQKFSDWKKDDEPYLKTTCGQVFWHDELEVELVK